MLTGEIKKEKKFVYCRCTGNRSECDLPRFREEDFAERLGESLKGLQGPSEIVRQIVTTSSDDQKVAAKVNTERTRLESRLTAICDRMDAAYIDKLDGRIDGEFWGKEDGGMAA